MLTTETSVPAEAVVLAAPGDHGFAHHRIPALVLLADHSLLASWDGRPDDGDSPAPNSILQRRSTDLGRTWGPVEVVHAGHPGIPLAGFSDPSYVHDEVTGAVFNFHVASHDTGFWDACAGIDDSDRRIMSAEVSTSLDGGRQWTHRLVTAQVKPPTFHGFFASSGAGIQIREGAHAGRLVQQFCGRRPATEADGIDHEWVVQAWSVFSDDHGRSWQHGTPVGTGLDENKVVELPGGRLMMNARDHRAGGCRLVCFSDDGGATWTEPRPEPQLPDPACNAHITRDWFTGDGTGLLFSHASDPRERRHGLLRRSRDEGRSWSPGVVFSPGSTLYSVVQALPDGHAGIFWDSAGVLHFLRVDLSRVP